MIRIEHIAQTLERWDNWTGYDEAKIRRLLGVDDKKAGGIPTGGKCVD